MSPQISFFDDHVINYSKKHILLSLGEQYYNAILKGEKKYEYRTRFLKEECNAFIYISKTKKSVVGMIEFGKPIYGTPEEISMIYENENEGGFNLMIDYLDGRNCYAIPVLKVTPINEISLEELRKKFKGFSPPQLYYILNRKKEMLDYFMNNLY